MQPLVNTPSKTALPPDALQTLSAETTLAHTIFQTLRRTTPNILHWPSLHHTPFLSTLSTTVYLKLESEQVTNSFKPRGALHLIQNLLSTTPSAKIVTASTGNHALAVIHALTLHPASGLIFLPTTAAPAKMAMLRAVTAAAHDVRIVQEGTDCLQAELAARHAADSDENMHYVSPYNDFLVIAGQGTVAVEIAETVSLLHPDSRGPKSVYVAVGGGGLIAGMGAYLRTVASGEWRVVGCVPRNSAVMYDSVVAGEIVKSKVCETLADGSAGQVEEGALTLPLCREVVDAWAVVDEEEIAAAVREVFVKERKVIEGAAGLAVAGFRRDVRWREENFCEVAVLVVCGGNVEPASFVKIVGGSG